MPTVKHDNRGKRKPPGLASRHVAVLTLIQRDLVPDSSLLSRRLKEGGVPFRVVDPVALFADDALERATIALCKQSLGILEGFRVAQRVVIELPEQLAELQPAHDQRHVPDVTAVECKKVEGPDAEISLRVVATM